MSTTTTAREGREESDMDSIRIALIAEARAEKAQYPQYDGYFDDWQVAEVTYPIRSKWGDLMAEVGDLVLIEPMPRVSIHYSPVIFLPGRKHWSGRGCCTAISGGVRRLVG
jgi:hypothetical protein